MRSVLRCARRAHSSAPTAEALGGLVSAEAAALAAAGQRLNWVFLGAPGVGKGTYASRVAKLLGVPHVSAGDLVRDEIKAGSELAKEVRGAAASAAVCSARAPARRRCPRSA